MTSRPQQRQRRYLLPPWAGGSRCSVYGSAVVPESISGVVGDVDMLRLGGEARSGVYQHAPAITDRCPALLSVFNESLPLSSYEL